MSTTKRIADLTRGTKFRLNGAGFTRHERVETSDPFLGDHYFWASPETHAWSHIFYGSQEVEVDEPALRLELGKLYRVGGRTVRLGLWFCHSPGVGLPGIVLTSQRGVTKSEATFREFVDVNDFTVEPA